MMKDIWLVVRYIPNLLWRLIKEVVSLTWEFFIEMPLILLSEIACGVFDDFREYSRKENATAGDDSSDISPFDQHYFYERARAKYGSSGLSSTEINAIASVEYLDYLLYGTVNHEWLWRQHTPE